jgi:hypothetical protein
MPLLDKRRLRDDYMDPDGTSNTSDVDSLQPILSGEFVLDIQSNLLVFVVNGH